MNSKKTIDILICLFWWLTVSLVFPFQAKKRGLVKRGWVRWLLTLLSPAALFTYLMIAGLSILSSYADINLDDIEFKTREDIVLLTQVTSIPEVKLKSYWRDVLEGTVFVRFEYDGESADAFFSDLEKRCAHKEDLYWEVNPVSGYDFERGWYAGPMEKPNEAFSDNVGVRVHFTDMGVDIQYDYQPFVFKDLSTQEQLSEQTGVQFPPFEIVDYRWHPVGPDAVATMTLQLREKPRKAFIRELKAKWRDDGAGSFVWRNEDYGADGIPERAYTILVTEGSPVITIQYASY